MESHNKAFAEGKVSYQKELNAFADIDGDSFSANYCGYKPSNDTRTETMSSASDFSNVGQLDTNFDWKAKGMVTPVKYQGVYLLLVKSISQTFQMDGGEIFRMCSLTYFYCA